MGKPRLLAENFWSIAQFPGHSISTALYADSYKLGTARRGALNTISPLNPTNILTVDLTLDRVRLADTLVLDRNSVAAGRRFQLVAKSDTAAVWPILEDVLPSDVVLGSSLNDAPHAIRTSEGAYIFSFAPVAASTFGITMWNDVVSDGKFGGAYLGLSYTPTWPRMPWDDEAAWADFDKVARGVPDNDWRYGRSMTVRMMMDSEAEWNELRKVRELAKRGHPVWVAPDSDKAERSGLFYLEGGSFAAPFSERPQGRTVDLELGEYHPLRPT